MLRNCIFAVLGFLFLLTVTSACPCSPEKLWLDVVLVVETTNAVRQDGVEQLEAFLESTFFGTTISQEPTGLRLGVISYAEKAVRAAELTTFVSTVNMLDTLKIPFLGGTVNNAEKALSEAIKMHQEQGNAKRRRVIVLIASSLQTEAFDPFDEAQDFKSDGGTLITIENIPKHGLPVPQLSQLASAGYNLSTAADLHSKDLVQALCDANCFCPPAHSGMSTELRGQPTGGCFFPSSLTADRLLAERSCDEMKEGAHLPILHDKQTNEFLFKEYPVPDIKIWLGLKVAQNGTMHWDKTNEVLMVEQQDAYAPFSPERSSGHCVYTSETGSRSAPVWHRANCDEDFLYVCQVAPCSTDKMC